MIEQARAAGKGAEAVANADLTDRIAPVMEQAVLAMYHANQARAWTANIIEGFEVLMAEAGIHSRLERLPAICFRSHRLHAADPGAWRLCGRRPGDDGRAAGAAQLRAARRQAHQVVGRRA